MKSFSRLQTIHLNLHIRFILDLSLWQEPPASFRGRQLLQRSALLIELFSWIQPCMLHKSLVSNAKSWQPHATRFLTAESMARPKLKKTSSTFFHGNWCNCVAVLNPSDLHFLWRFLHVCGGTFAARRNTLLAEACWDGMCQVPASHGAQPTYA